MSAKERNTINIKERWRYRRDQILDVHMKDHSKDDSLVLTTDEGDYANDYVVKKIGSRRKLKLKLTTCKQFFSSIISKSTII